MGMVGDARQVLHFVWTHPANRGRRLRSTARAVGYQVRGRMGRRTMTTIGRHGRMWVDLHSNGASKVLYANPPDWSEMQAWRRILQRGDLFVDVGSNVGSYALWAADLGAEVTAIEPSPQAARNLQENVLLNDFTITVLECGLADEPGRMTLTTGKDTVNHLLTDPAAVGDRISVDTLDNVLGDRHAVGVKIDVEGAERLVLDGARLALSQSRIDVLQIEWNDMSDRVFGESRAPAAKILSTYGYQFMRPNKQGVLQPSSATLIGGEDLFAVSPKYQKEMM